MGLSDIKRALSFSSTTSTQPPPYSETSPATNNASTSSQPPSPLRTLKVEYSSGTHPNRISIFEKDDDSHPLYWAELHGTRLAKGHMEFKTPPDSEIGSATFHQSGPSRVDLTFHGSAVTMTGYFGATYSMLSFVSVAARQKIRWKRPGQAYDLICLDDTENELASLKFGEVVGGRGEVRIFNMDVGRNERLLEEVVFSGLAYVHLCKYFPTYAGGASLAWL